MNRRRKVLLSATNIADIIAQSESDSDDDCDNVEDTDVTNQEIDVDMSGDYSSEEIFFPNPGVNVYYEPSDGEILEDESNSDISSDGSDILSTPDETSEFASMKYTSPNGIEWSDSPPPPRRLARNLISFREGPTVTPPDELSAFLLFFDEIILRTIMRYTNRRMRAKKLKPFLFCEIQAGMAIIIRAGADKDNLSDLIDLYDSKDSRPFYRCAMPKRRMKELLENVTLDEKKTRQQRQQQDKLAAIREVWELFRVNLRRYYVPSCNLTIDEQLYAYRGYVPGRAYMPSKPSKYGIKIFWINDAKNGFALDCYIYSGKGETRETGLAEKVVLQLSSSYNNTNRNIFMDRFFTSYNLILKLLENGLTATGTIPANRRDIPQEFKNSNGREQFDSRALYESSNRIIMVSYVPKKRKNVLLLSSAHDNLRISSRIDKKPDIILDYNSGKGGTDLMDSRIEDFTCKRKTRRYPLIFLFDMLDVSLLNAFLIHEMNGYSSSRKIFIKKVSDQLAFENIQRRYRNGKVYSQVKTAFTQYGLPIHSRAGGESHDSRLTGPRKCQAQRCSKSTRTRCCICLRPVCSSHKITSVQCIQCDNQD